VDSVWRPVLRDWKKMKFSDCSIFRFSIVGLINTFIGLSVIYLSKFIGFDDVVSNLIGYSFGLVASFILNKKWTFLYEGSNFSAALKFSAVTVVAYLSNLLVVVFLLDTVRVNGFIAQAAAVPVYALVAYVGYRRFVFPEKTHG
jgi:putative flippase GtrA